MKRFVGVLTLLAALVIPGAVGASTGPSSDAKQTGPRVDTTYALVQLTGAPLATSEKTKPAPGKKIDFNNSAVKAYRAQLSALRNDFKAWLRANAPKAKVTGEYDISLNAVSVQLNGVALAKVASAPQVQRAEYAGVYYPAIDNDPDLTIINAAGGWAQVGGAENAGEGVKVAIVDSGIDVTHPCFSDGDYPSQTQVGDRRFTNNKVIAAKVFNNKAANQGLTAEAIDSHGTHVAGTVACNYHTPAAVDGVAIPYAPSGVAPRALLGNYNVFPGNVGSARSEDILNALEAAYSDKFDVANMSLGGGASGIQDLLTIAVDNLDIANMVVAVAAGNDGPGGYTVGSPGSAARALTAGASTVPHFVGSQVQAGSERFDAATGDFPTVKTDLTAPLGVVAGTTNGLNTACGALTAGSLSGKIALISRGACTFSTKIRNAQNAGAVAVIVANHVAGDPISMAQDGTPDQPTVPAYMVSRDNGVALIDFDQRNVTIGAPAYVSTGSEGQDIMAGFSSQGPTDVDFRVKPDVVAPGVNVLSSVPGACGPLGCWAFFQGTSMATPHLAGSAAIVRQKHPDWSAAQVRSAIVNTADQGVLKSYTDGKTIENDANIVGAGRENLGKAVNAAVALDPVSISFGAVPAGSGLTKTLDLTLTNLGDATATYALSVGASSGSGVSYALSAPSITLGSGEPGTVTVTLRADKGMSLGSHQALLKVSANGDEVAHAVVFTFAK